MSEDAQDATTDETEASTEETVAEAAPAEADEASESVAEEAPADEPVAEAEAPAADETPAEEPVAEDASVDEPVAEEASADDVPVEDEPVADEAPTSVNEAFGPVRVARVFVCEKGHRTTTLWGEPDICQAQPLRSGPSCGMKLYHITELPEQVQKALNPLKASKKASKKK